MVETFYVTTSEVVWGPRVTVFWNLKNWGNDEDFNRLLEHASYPVDVLNEGQDGPQARLRFYFQVHHDQPPWLSLNAEQLLNVGNRVEQYGFQVDYVGDDLTVLNNESLSRLLNSRTVRPDPTGNMIVKVICPALAQIPGEDLASSPTWVTTGPFKRPRNLGLKITVTPCYIPTVSKVEQSEEGALAAAAGKYAPGSEGAEVKGQKKGKKKAPQKGTKPERSLMCLGLENPLRRACYAITEAKPFEYFILVTILATCACLALATPYPNNDSDTLNDSLEEFEIVFTVIFTAECAMSIIAKGFIAHEGAYLRENMWNCLDFTIVSIGLLSSLLSSMLEGFDVKALRAFRVLRPLKLVSGVPALQIVMNAILMAMVPLFHIALLVLFVIAIYAIIGLEMFEGQLHRTCFHNVTGEMMKDPANCGGGYNCEDENEEGEIPAWYCSLYWEGPYDGIINFDNIVQAMLTVFTCISLEGWTDLMYKLQDAMGTGWEWLYFSSMVVFGAFMVMNLIIGVLCGEFSKQKEKAESRIEFQQQRQKQMMEKELGGYLDWITAADDCDSVREENGGGEDDKAEGGGDKETLLPSFWKTAMEGCNRANHRLRRASRKMIKSQGFYWTIIVLVFLNTVVLATEHYQQPQWLDDFQNGTNVFFVALFTGEMLLKMYSLGISRYFASLFNRFDFFATVSSILELYLNKTGQMAPMGISVLRCVRLLRVFKVTRYWKALSSLVGSILGSITSIVSLIFLLFLFIFIFALLGMQIFGGKFAGVDPSDYTPRTNFDAFAHALLTVFQILTGEDWNEVMYLGILGFGGPETVKGLLASLYFIILFVLGNLVMLNVFLAIAVDNLELEEEEEEVVEKVEEAPPPPQEAAEIESGTEGGEEGAQPPPTDEEAGPDLNQEAAPPGAADAEPPSNPPIPEGSAFFILSQTNPLRVFCFKFITHPIIGNFLLVCILVSSALMGAEDPVYEDSEGNKQLEKLDYFFTTVFTIELTTKLIVYGLIMHEGAFLRSGANVLDFVVVGVSLVSIFSSGRAVETIKILRVCRVLRPLRAINRAKGLKRVIQCMIVAIQTIGNIVVVTSLLTFMYAVMGVQLFKGALFQCTDPSKLSAEECQGTYIAFEGDREVVEEREWFNSPFNYDSVPNAMLTLFAVCTFEGWPQMLYKSIDAAGQDLPPVYNNRLLVAVYYVSYLIIISLFLINIFVGFVIMTFQSEGEKEYAHADMEKNQRNCLEFAMTAKPIKVYIPNNRFQYTFWLVTQTSAFSNISFGLIILNTMSMAMKFYEQPEWYSEFLDKANLFFTVAFTIEFLLKLVAMGPGVYCSDAWNVFDAVIVMGSYVDIIFPEVDVAFLKLFRVGRLIKLLNKSEGIRKILFTFIKSFQTLPYVILLLVLLFFIYAIIGMSTFAKIALDEDTEIHRNNNFQNFGNTALLLFRCATGEAWQEIMMACSGGDHVKCFFPPEDGSPDKCGSNAAYPYFISFVVFCSFLVLNLFVAVIMDHFDYMTRDSSVLGSHHLGEFVQQWAEYDPDARGKIRHADLVNLLRNMEPPLGFGKLCPKRRAWKRLVAMNMPMNTDGTVDFNATLFALVRTALQIRTEGNIRDADEELRSTLQALWKDLDPKVLDRVVPPPEVLDEVTVGKYYATLLIQGQYRKHQKKTVVETEEVYE